MRILIAPDKFKDSLSAIQVGLAVAKGIDLFDPNIETILFPLADGGEGTSAILTYHTGGRLVPTETQDPLSRPITAVYGLSGDGKTAYIEMAEASGLSLLKIAERNPLLTSTYGTGLMILEAINKGARRIILGIGGSATNDAGMGLAAALGFRFLNDDGKELAPIGKNLIALRRIDRSSLLFNLDEVQFEVACDVRNPFYGPQGAAFVYAAQKGASAQQIEELDQGLRHCSKIISQDLAVDMAMLPGSGAAGGLGGGAVAFLNATLTPGIELVMNTAQFDQALENIDLIITGEGKIDGQTISGKVVAGVVEKARSKQIPVAAVCGILSLDPAGQAALGLQMVRSLVGSTTTPAAAMDQAFPLLQELSRSMIQELVESL